MPAAAARAANRCAIVLVLVIVGLLPLTLPSSVLEKTRPASFIVWMHAEAAGV